MNIIDFKNDKRIESLNIAKINITKEKLLYFSYNILPQNVNMNINLFNNFDYL